MRPLTATIRLENLRQNYQRVKELRQNRVLAVVKANAYGHKAVPCAQALAPIADGFAVSCMAEALQLRHAGIQNPILLLEGVFHSSELKIVEEQQLWIVVQSQQQVHMVEEAQPTRPFTVWLMLDSGMHREGLPPEAYKQAWQKLKRHPNVSSLVKMTHFACADEPNAIMTQQQMACFDNTVKDLPGLESLANTAGALYTPASCRDWIRMGIGLYTPLPETTSSNNLSGLLKPVMSLTSRIFATRQADSGVIVGYGAHFTTTRPTRLGLVACGYADGYPRNVNNQTRVWINGSYAPVVGRISMDMLTIDITNLPEATVGTMVELWGDNVSINEVAHAAQTISYEVLCNVKRAHFELTD